MMVDHALGIAGRSGSVVERNGIPLVAGHQPIEIRVAACQQCLVVHFPHVLTAFEVWIFHIHDQNGLIEHPERIGHHRGELPVRNEHLRPGVPENKSNRFRIQARVDGIQHGARHRYAEMRLEHLRDIGKHRRNRIAASHALPGKRRRETDTAFIDVSPASAQIAMNNRVVIGVQQRGPLQEAERRQLLVVRRAFVQILFIDTHRHLPSGCQRPQKVPCYFP